MGSIDAAPVPVSGLAKREAAGGRPRSGPGRQQGNGGKGLPWNTRSSAGGDMDATTGGNAKGKREGTPTLTPKGAFLTGVDAGGMELQQRLFQVSSEQNKLREELKAYMSDVKNRVSETDGTLLLDFGDEDEFSRALEEQETAWKFRMGRASSAEDEKLARGLKKIAHLDSKLDRLDIYAEEVRRETLKMLGELPEEKPRSVRSSGDSKSTPNVPEKNVCDPGDEELATRGDDAASVSTSSSRGSRRKLGDGHIDHVKRNRQLAAMEGSLTSAEEARVAALMGDGDDVAATTSSGDTSTLVGDENAYVPAPAIMKQLQSVSDALGKCDGPFKMDLTSVVSDALERARAHADIAADIPRADDILMQEHLQKSQKLTMAAIDEALVKISAGEAYTQGSSHCAITPKQVAQVVNRTAATWENTGDEIASTAQVDHLLALMGARPRSAPANALESVIGVSRPHQVEECTVGVEFDISRGRVLPAKRRLIEAERKKIRTQATHK